MAVSPPESRPITSRPGYRRSAGTGIAPGSHSKHKFTTATTNANVSRGGMDSDSWPVSGLKASSTTSVSVPSTPNTEMPKMNIPSVSVASRPKTQGNKKTLESKQKPRKSLREDSGESSTPLHVENTELLSSESFALLYKLFVPNKYPIKNNKYSLRHLLNHLPLIIPTSSTSQESNNYLNLNFHIHMFLSNIVVNYVNSWYLAKLNTDNIEFVRLIYQLMCDLIKDLSRRINAVLNKESCIWLIDQICQIFNDHLGELVCTNCDDTYDLKFLNDYFDTAKSKNTINDHTRDSDELLADFLANQHLVFDKNLALDNDNDDDDSDDPADLFANETLERIEEQFKAKKRPVSDSNQLMYFRIIVRKILVTTFDSGSEGYTVNPLTSKISSDLIILLMSDLVLNKVFEKLASPGFILGQIKCLIDSVDSSLDARIKRINQPKEPQPFHERARSVLSTTYRGVSYVINGFGRPARKSKEEVLESTEKTGPIFENSLFKLLNTLTNFSNRKPLLSSILTFIKNYVLIHPVWESKINSICSRYVFNKVVNSRALSDEFLCQIVNGLREDLFNDTVKEEKQQLEITVDTLADKLVEIISVKVPQIVPFDHAYLFKYHNETDEDLRASLRKFLVIFNYVPGSSNNEINESCELNKLLVINLLDCIVANLYPEI